MFLFHIYSRESSLVPACSFPCGLVAADADGEVHLVFGMGVDVQLSVAHRGRHSTVDIAWPVGQLQLLWHYCPLARQPCGGIVPDTILLAFAFGFVRLPLLAFEPHQSPIVHVGLHEGVPRSHSTAGLWHHREAEVHRLLQHLLQAVGEHQLRPMHLLLRCAWIGGFVPLLVDLFTAKHHRYAVAYLAMLQAKRISIRV